MLWAEKAPPMKRNFFQVFILCILLLASVCHGARIALLNGASLNGPIATNSVLTDISLEDGVAVSCSQTDSQITLAPFDENWAAVDEGTLLGDLTVVSGASKSPLRSQRHFSLVHVQWRVLPWCHRT
jgi:hypothetical protein